jgi:hypothetical protein
MMLFFNRTRNLHSFHYIFIDRVRVWGKFHTPQFPVRHARTLPDAMSESVRDSDSVRRISRACTTAWRLPCGGGMDANVMSPVEPRRPGMQSPDGETFAQQRLEERMASILTVFLASPECRERLDDSPRYLRPLLQMMSDLGCDLTALGEPSLSDGMALEALLNLPVWARTADLAQADRMVAEVVAFFAFGARTGCLRGAQPWYELVTHDAALAELLRCTMRTDARLRKLRPPRKRQRPARHKRKKRGAKAKRGATAPTCGLPALE